MTSRIKRIIIRIAILIQLTMDCSNATPVMLIEFNSKYLHEISIEKLGKIILRQNKISFE